MSSSQLAILGFETTAENSRTKDPMWWAKDAGKLELELTEDNTSCQAWDMERMFTKSKTSRPRHSFYQKFTRRKFSTGVDEWASKEKNETVDITAAAPSGIFLVQRSWEGYVLKVEKESFTARLIDPDRKRQDEEAEFALTEIPSFDHDLVAVGSVFYWMVGFQDSPAGSRTRASTLRFRRLPVWSEAELETAKVNADRLLSLFD